MILAWLCMYFAYGYLLSYTIKYLDNREGIVYGRDDYYELTTLTAVMLLWPAFVAIIIVWIIKESIEDQYYAVKRKLLK